MLDLMKTLGDLIQKPALGAVQGAGSAVQGVGNVTQQAGQTLGQVAQAMPAPDYTNAGTAGGFVSGGGAGADPTTGRVPVEGELTPWQKRAQDVAPIVSKMGERKKEEMGPPPPLPAMQGMVAPQMYQPQQVVPYRRQF